MKIGDVARHTGLKTSALRFYEQVGLLPAPARQSGRREYDPSVLDRLAILQFAQACGFQIKETRELVAPLLDGERLSGRWRQLAEKKVAELDQLIDRANQMKEHLSKAMACRCAQVDECGKTIRRRAKKEARP